MKPLVFEATLLIYPWKIKLLTKEEALAGLNEMIRMGWRCSTQPKLLLRQRLRH